MPSHSAFAPGQIVKIVSLKRRGTVQTRLQSGAIKVLVGKMSLQVNPEDLELEPSQAVHRPGLDSEQHAGWPSTQQIVRKAPPSMVDLHGLRVREALTIVEDSIDRAILHDMHRLSFMHGHGSGKLMNSLHRYLGTLKVVQRFELDPGNPGVTVVYL